MARLAEIYAQEKKTGGGLGTAVGKTAMEKMDPRQIFDQKGIITAIFPSLKPYKASREKISEKITPDLSNVSLNVDTLNEISASSRITAKNSLVLPSMARDMYLVKQNIVKLVKTQGVEPQTKAGDWFSRQMARESAFELAMKSMGRRSGGQGATMVLGAGKKRDGQSKETALFVEGVDKGLGIDAALTPDVFKKILGSVVGFLSSPILLAGLGLGGLAALFWKMYTSKGAFEAEDSEVSKGIKQAEKVGGLAGVKDEAERRKKLPEYDRTMLELKDYEELHNEGQKLNELQLEGFKRRSVEAARAVEDYKKINNILPTPKAVETPDESQAETARLLRQANPPAEGPAPTPVPSGEPGVPSNVVVSGSGAGIRTGTGGYVVSGEAPSPATAPETTAPSKITPSASVPSVAGLPIDYKAYADKIGQKESGGNYGAVNTLGYLGKYQFGALALQDMGLVKKGTSLKGLDNPDNWNIAGGKQAFLNNAQLQEETMAKYTRQNYATLNRIGVINKDSSPQEVAGYLAASHLLGPGGAKQLAQGNVSADAYGTTSATYYKVGSATQGIPSGTAVAAAPSMPTTGAAVATASSSMAEGQRVAMAPAAGTTIVDNSTKTTVAGSSAPSKPASAYDRDIVEALITSSYA